MRILLLVLIWTTPLLCQGRASLRGVVEDEAGRGLAWMRVVVVKDEMPAAGPPENYVVTAGADGRFVVEGVSAGQYRVCLDVGVQELLNPCEWGAEERVRAGNGESRAVRLVARRGVRILVVLDDPQAVKAGMLDGDFNVYARPGAWSADGRMHGARYVGTVNRAHRFELLAPEGAELDLWMDSGRVKVLDAGRREVNRSSRIKVRASKAAPVTVRFSMER